MSAAVEDRTNPKDLVGQAKVDLSLMPAAGIIHAAHAMMDGAAKYGPYNWRERAVKSRVYISAAQRHLLDYLDGQDEADDSGVHHLGHAIACCAIILDAFEVGNLIDDRPTPGRAVGILDRLNAKIAARRRDATWAGAANADIDAEKRRAADLNAGRPIKLAANEYVEFRANGDKVIMIRAATPKRPAEKKAATGRRRAGK